MYNFESWVDVRSAFEQAAGWFVLTAAAGVDCCEARALGDWTVRDLIGHTSRALITVENYLDKEVAAVEINSSVEYFRAASASIGDPAAVALRGRDAGAALGPDVGAAVEKVADRVLARVRTEKPDALVVTPVGGMRLIDYLPTRTFELTVHTSDLAVALGQPLDLPPTAAAESFSVLGGLAAQSGTAGPILLAATGRRALPSGFTVL